MPGASWRIALVAALSLAGCARGTRPSCENPPPFYVRLEGSERLNPSNSGQALTTQVLVFQLRSTAKFDPADFEDVWQKPKDVLGEDLVEMNEVTLDPGGSVTTGFARNSKSTQIAVVGIFRQPTGSSWRAVTALPSPRASDCTSEPAPVPKSPAKGAAVLPFFLEDFRVEPKPTYFQGRAL